MSEFQCAIQFKECMRRSMKYTEADMRCSLASSAWMGPRTTSLRGGSSASTVALVGQTLRFNSKACLERNANRLRTRNLILQDLVLWCQLEMYICYVWLDLLLKVKVSLRLESLRQNNWWKPNMCVSALSRPEICAANSIIFWENGASTSQQKHWWRRHIQ